MSARKHHIREMGAPLSSKPPAVHAAGSWSAARPSPARELQADLQSRFSTSSDPEVVRWPAPYRAAFLLTGSLSLWGLIGLGLGRLLKIGW